jgi:hypothetical protein
VVAWFSNAPEADHPEKQYNMGRFPRPVFNGYEQGAYDYVRSFLRTYLDIASRLNTYEYDFHDFVNIFNKTFDYCYHLLTSQDVELVLFSEPPHVGTDWVLYCTARYLGLKTIICQQIDSLPGKFLYTLDLEDYGTFNSALTQHPFKLHEIQTLTDKPSGETIDRKRLRRPNVWDMQILPYLHGLQAALLLVRYKRFRIYEKSFARYARTDINLNEKFIYFPLQGRNDLTLAILGGQYADQLLAIEHLSAKLPKGWFIYLHENAEPNEFMRGRYFWERLKTLQNIKFVPINMSPQKLIRHAQLVATVTHEVGWWTITRGKPILVFGKPWYLNMPGVYRYQDGLELEEVQNIPVDSALLAQKYSILCQKAVDGIVSRQAAKSSGFKFSRTTNKKNLAVFLKAILAESFVPVTAC